ncbi:tyrosine-type recombinase/integrase [Sporichthya brevicatena]|uniref:Tyrosine-type recombinase/integrase n=1 Tax=Sporichthya brevicatena TaxID=171442 RepID=A0ABN1G429_9ACTN
MPWVMKRRSDSGPRFQAIYRDPTGRKRSAGTFRSERDARAAARRAESSVESGAWYDRTAGKVTFRNYVEQTWWPSRHLEVSTKAGYRSYLDKHFLPYFGDLPMAKILPSTVQGWVTKAVADGLSPRSVVKYHVMLHSIFKRAVRDRIISFNPCSETELPKVVARRMPTVTPEEFEHLLSAVPARWQPLVLTAIETGLRWGELVALRPRHLDFLRRTLTVEETIVEVSKKTSPTGERMIVKPYPKDDEPRTIRVSQDLLDVLAARIKHLGIDRDHLLFPSTEMAGGNPVSRNTFRTRVWLPALEEAQLGHHVRMHDLRHAHASWLLAGGADLKTVMERMGHSQIQTTQKYLHTLPDADDRALEAFRRTRGRRGT